jgi:hypothetical protein
MKPKFNSHEYYQDYVLKILREFYADENPFFFIPNSDFAIISKLWITDISSITTMLDCTYSHKGPTPRPPDTMFRSYLLMLFTNPTLSITEWVDCLRRTPFYAILSGFKPGDTPGVGTFYDFLKRLWLLDTPNIKSKLKHKKTKKKKQKKLKKGEKSPLKKPGIIKRLVDRHFKYGSKMKDIPTDFLYSFFESIFLKRSASLGLLGNLKNLGFSGDGTPIVTSSFLRSKSTCDCFKNGISKCNHKRIFSQPDINCGWDSSRGKNYNGYHLYMLSASDSYYDLPLYPKLNPASRHDSVSLLLTLDEFHHRFSVCPVNKVLLDAAHDAGSIYKLFDHYDIEPFIDLNPRTKHNLSTDCDIKISPEGIPICSANLKMKSNGFEKSKNRKKWRCPSVKNKVNSCNNPCSTSLYGRAFHTHPQDDLRIFTKTPRGSKKWIIEYKRRSSIERSNKREKVDYHLESGHHRSTMMWSIRLYAIMMCQHIDAWDCHLNEDLNIKNILF